MPVPSSRIVKSSASVSPTGTRKNATRSGCVAKVPNAGGVRIPTMRSTLKPATQRRTNIVDLPVV